MWWCYPTDPLCRGGGFLGGLGKASLLCFCLLCLCAFAVLRENSLWRKSSVEKIVCHAFFNFYQVPHVSCNTLYKIQRAKYTAQNTLYNIHCTTYDVQHTLHTTKTYANSNEHNCCIRCCWRPWRPIGTQRHSVRSFLIGWAHCPPLMSSWSCGFRCRWAFGPSLLHYCFFALSLLFLN